MLNTPHFLLCHRIPCGKKTTNTLQVIDELRRVCGWDRLFKVGPQVPVFWRVFKGVVLGVIKTQIKGRYIDQTCIGMEAHWMPVVSTQWAWLYAFAVVGVVARWAFHRSAGFWVNMGRPIHRNISLGRNEVAIGAVDDIKETVFRRLHDDFARLIVNFNVCQDHVLSGGIVPGIARRGLVVPNVLTGVGIQCHD